MIKKLTLIFSLIFVNLLFAQQKGETIDKILAVVDDEIILSSEVEQFVQNLIYQNSWFDKSAAEIEQLRKSTLERLINQKILLAKAIDDTVKIDASKIDEAVEEQVKRLLEHFGTEEKVIEQVGYSLKEIRRKYSVEVGKNMKVEKLQREKFAKVTVSRKEVEEFYQANLDSFPKIDASVKISHVLLDATAGGSAKNSALQKILVVQDSLKKGGSFTELAKKFSDDPGSKNNGGELGWVERGVFVREYEEVAFSLSQNQVSEIVETQFGFHIIQLIEKRGEKINTRHILAGFTTTQADEKAVLDTLSSYKKRIENGKETFEEIAQKYSLDKESTKKGGSLGWFEIPKLTNSAFKEQIEKLKIGEISEPFKSEFGFHILKLEDKKEPRKLSMSEDWEQIQEMALNFKKEQDYQKWVAKIRENVFVEIRN
ncbi:peptidylprolyl isomerase [bacterium]|nr:peptidylprolyl isomerase [bacterium]